MLEEARTLVRSFPYQPLDFFGAARARVVDADVADWIARQGGAGRLQDSLMANYDWRIGYARWQGGGHNTQPGRGVTSPSLIGVGKLSLPAGTNRGPRRRPVRQKGPGCGGWVPLL